MKPNKNTGAANASSSASETTTGQVIQSYRDLRVFKIAFDSAMKIYAFSKMWPREEKYSLTDQIRRASRSVCGNIAEAWRKRSYPLHFVSKLSDADAEGAETEVWLDFALRCGYIPESDHKELRDHYDHIGGMLRIMMNNPGKWCGRVMGEGR